MKHRKDKTNRLGRTTAHCRCTIANLLKNLILHGSIKTTVTKAKVLRRHAEKMITLAKKNTLATRRKAIAEMMIRFNTLTSKEARAAKKGDTSGYNSDRKIIGILFGELGTRFTTREGGYTRIIPHSNRVGDNAPTCVIEYLES